MYLVCAANADFKVEEFYMSTWRSRRYPAKTVKSTTGDRDQSRPQ